MKKEPENIIIGAGLTGLSAAYAAKNAVIYEKENYIGGLSRTEEFGEFTFDIGGHRFLTNKPRIESLIQNLLKDELLEINRKSKIFTNNKLLDYPIKTSIILQINPFELLRMFLFYFYRKYNPKKEYSFEDKTINLFGDEIYRYYFEKYTEKIWGFKCNRLSKDWAEARLPGISLKRAIMHALFGKEKAKSFSDKFLYPKYGIGTIAYKLSKGLNINLAAEITGIKHSDNKIECLIINNEEIYCRNVLSTMPINKLVKMFNVPQAVTEASNRLKYRSVICVFLVMDVENLTNVHWIYFPGNEIFGRLHEPKNWSHYMAPPDQTGICLEIFCNQDSKIWQMNDIEIATCCVNDLYNFTKKKSIAHKIVKIEDAYPIYDIDYYKYLSIIKDYLSKFNNLFIAGRTGSFDYLNMDDCIEEGLKIGELLADK